MGQSQPIVHIVDFDAKSRAEQARMFFTIGWHAEVYGDLDELFSYVPERGIILLREGVDDLPPGKAVEVLTQRGVWLPVVMAAPEPRVRDIVAAIKAGALDYLALPLEGERLRDRLTDVAVEAAEQANARRRLIEARARIETLSARERQVLDWLAEGNSNKTIARELRISPRTVEIHRANMMGKLGARHPADAVRVRLESGL